MLTTLGQNEQLLWAKPWPLIVRVSNGKTCPDATLDELFAVEGGPGVVSLHLRTVRQRQRTHWFVETLEVEENL